MKIKTKEKTTRLMVAFAMLLLVIGCQEKDSKGIPYSQGFSYCFNWK